MPHPASIPLLVLEGPDCGGKTTLAKELEAKGWRYVHTGPPQTGLPYLEYRAVLADVAMKRTHGVDVRPVVIDRLHLGERVYGPVLREVDRLGPTYHRMVDRILLGLGAVVLGVWTDKVVMERAWAERAAKNQELITDRARFLTVCDRFKEIFAAVEARHGYYDYQLADEFGDVEEFMTAHLREYPNPGPGIGRWAPGEVTLLVGERVNGGERDWPFTGIGGSSRWLTEELMKYGVPEGALYWVNACDVLGAPLSADFVHELRPRKVIALGDVAERWCLESESAVILANFVKVPHPAFWKRFQSGRPYPLQEALRA